MASRDNTMPLFAVRDSNHMHQGFPSLDAEGFSCRMSGLMTVATKATWQRALLTSLTSLVSDKQFARWNLADILHVVFNPPICPVNGSAYPGIERASEYMIKVIDRLQKDHLKSVSVKPSAQAAFTRWVQSRMPEMVWSEPCSSWCTYTAYKQFANFGLTNSRQAPEWQSHCALAWHYTSLLRGDRVRALGRL